MTPDDRLRISAWIAARVLEQGDTIGCVAWLALQLERIDRGDLVESTPATAPRREEEK